jgi:hypothetical protein
VHPRVVIVLAGQGSDKPIYLSVVSALLNIFADNSPKTALLLVLAIQVSAR